MKFRSSKNVSLSSPIQRLEETPKSLEETNKNLVKINKEQAEIILHLESTNKAKDNTINEQKGTIESQHHLIQELQQKNEEFHATIKKLMGFLCMNSKNSSKPPSSDGPDNSTPKSSRPQSGKNPGAQLGHEGSHLPTPEKVDEFVEHEPTACNNCPNHDECMKYSRVGETRHEIDAIVTVKVTAHQSLVLNCPLHGKQQKGEFPPNIKATVQYGANLNALVVSFNTIGAVSMERVHQILGSVFSIPLSPGTVYNMVHRCAGSLPGVMEVIRQKAIAAELIHCDETGTKVNGENMWTHVVANSEFTHLTINKSRGKIGIDAGEILPEFKGIAIHDCWPSYWMYKDISHGACGAHLLRELIWVEQNYPEQVWATVFKNLLLGMKAVKEKEIEKGHKSASRYYLKKFDRQYDEFLTLGYNENPPPTCVEKKPGKPKKGKVLSLVERLDLLKSEVCLFFTNFAVPFDNNLAERDIRILKVKTKVSGCFRSEEGAKDYAKIMSYVGTAKKLKINPYVAIRWAVVGTPELIFAKGSENLWS